MIHRNKNGDQVALSPRGNQSGDDEVLPFDRREYRGNSQRIQVPLGPIVELAEVCPWCGLDLDGEVWASWINGELRSLLQTRTIGNGQYTWTHTPAGCIVPALMRLPPLLPS